MRSPLRIEFTRPSCASQHPAAAALLGFAAAIVAVLPLPRPAVATAAPAGFVVCLRGAAASPMRVAWPAAVRSTRPFTEALALGTAAAATDPLAFDPARVWLLQAADSAAAAVAARQLLAANTALWIEPVVAREPLDAAPWPPAGVALGPAALPPGFPDDPLYRDGRQWGLCNTGTHTGVAGADIRAPAAWRRSCGAAWLRLAIADTGIDPAHPDLALALPDGPRIAQGLNVTAEVSRSWADSAAHGTAVAGVMAALTHDGAHFDSLGIAGVCGGDGAGNPGCRIVPLKITPGHTTSASSFDLARALVAAVAAGARAVNVSFGGTAPSRLEREAMRFCMERGCLVVCASGNKGAVSPRDPVYPAAYAADGFCLQVGASDAWDRRAVFSSYGPGLDLVAPGSDIWTTYLTYPSAGGATYPGYVAVAGTSFAAPFATGAAGLLFAARPELSADDARELLRATARDIGATGRDDETAAGVLDADAALEAGGARVGIAHDEVAADAYVDAGVDTLVVGETGPGTLVAGSWPAARRIEASVTLALPDSFEDGARVWPRVAGTGTMRGDFQLPYFAPHAEVEWLNARTFRLRGWGYRVASQGDSIDMPLPFDQLRFGFTIAGRVRQSWLERPVVPLGSELRAAPNPFTAALRIDCPSGAALEVFDLRGRRVRGWASNGSLAAVVWDGRDAAGHASPPGLYWVRARTAQGIRSLRVTKLE